MDQKKKMMRLWIAAWCLALATAWPLHAQVNVNKIQLCGYNTSNDSITLFLKLLDPQGRRINNLDANQVKGRLSITEDGQAINTRAFKVERVKSGVRIPASYTFSILVDRNISQDGKAQIYKAIRDLVDMAPDSCVYISFFGDKVSASKLITRNNAGEFEREFLSDAASSNYFYDAVYAKMLEFGGDSVAEYEDMIRAEDGYLKNEVIKRRAASHRDENYLLVFAGCAVKPSTGDIYFLEIDNLQTSDPQSCPVVYAFYYTGEGSLDDGVETTFKAIAQNIELPENRRGGYTPTDNLKEVINALGQAIEEKTYDYTFTYKALKDCYDGDVKYQAKWEDESGGAKIFPEINMTIGSKENPWYPKPVKSGPEPGPDFLKMAVRGLLALLTTLLTIAFFFLVTKVLLPWLKSKAFAAKHYKKYVPEANVQRRLCYYCKQDLQPGQMIVAKCKHYMHVHCWKTNQYRCVEYGQNCNEGIQEHVEWDTVFTKSSLRDCKQTIAGIVAGLVSWVAYTLLGNGSVFNALAAPLVKAFYKVTPELPDLTGYCVDKVSSFLGIGLLLGFFLSLVFRYNDEYRNKDWKVVLKIVGLSLVSGIIGMGAFAIGGCVLCAALPVLQTTNVPWYCSLPAYLLFSICVTLSLTIKSSVPVKSALLGGLCSAIIGFIVLYSSSKISAWLNVLINFIIYGGGLGASLVTVRSLAEKYFLVIKNGVKAGKRIPIHKWMNATGGGNKVTIGMTGDCEIQMNWEKSNKVAKEHAKLFVDRTKLMPMIQPLANGVVYNTRAELPVGKPSVLTNGDTFKIGDTIFQYVEND